MPQWAAEPSPPPRQLAINAPVVQYNTINAPAVQYNTQNVNGFLFSLYYKKQSASNIKNY